MHAAVLMVAMGSAIEMTAVRIAMDMPIMTPRAVHLAVLVVAVRPAVQVAPMRVSVHVAVVMTVVMPGLCPMHKPTVDARELAW